MSWQWIMRYVHMSVKIQHTMIKEALRIPFFHTCLVSVYSPWCKGALRNHGEVVMSIFAPVKYGLWPLSHLPPSPPQEFDQIQEYVPFLNFLNFSIINDLKLFLYFNISPFKVYCPLSHLANLGPYSGVSPNTEILCVHSYSFTIINIW